MNLHGLGSNVDRMLETGIRLGVRTYYDYYATPASKYSTAMRTATPFST